MRILSGILYGLYTGGSDYWKQTKRTTMKICAILTVVLTMTVLWVAEYESVSETVQLAAKWLWYPWEYDGPVTRLDVLLASGLVYIFASLLEIHSFKVKPAYMLFALVKTVAYALLMLIVSVLLIQLIQNRTYVQLFFSIFMLIPILLMMTIKHNPVFTVIEHVAILWFLSGHWPLEAMRLIALPSVTFINLMQSIVSLKWAVLVTLFFPLGLPNLIYYLEGRKQFAKGQFKFK